MGLVLGCIDLGYCGEGHYVFFEVNPNGQWLASELLTGAPITDAIAEVLVRGG